MGYPRNGLRLPADCSWAAFRQSLGFQWDDDGLFVSFPCDAYAINKK